MRGDLEEAMAAIIGSETACARFVSSPESFGSEFALSDSELAMLAEMASDLQSLTASFVSKRRSTLRWNAQRTLRLLGEEGDELLARFVEEHPMSDRFSADAAHFGDFVVEYTHETTLDPSDQVIAELARFERHRSRSFWGAIARTERPDSEGAAGSETSSRVRLAAGANVGAFLWDMRLAYRTSTEPFGRLPPDPCSLLFFHTGKRATLLTLRLRPAEASVIAHLSEDRPVPIEELRSWAEEGQNVDLLCQRLSWEGAVEWL